MAATSSNKAQQANASKARQRILEAAVAVFTRRGYAQASTLEIATIAKVSKRDLYALVGKKEDMLVACITERASRLKWPQDLPAPQDRKALAQALAQFGYQLLLEVTDPTVVSVFRLAIAEAERAPEVAQTLDTIGRATARDALSELFTQAAASNLLKGDAAEMARRFLVFLWGDLMLELLLNVVKRPAKKSLMLQANRATETFMQFYSTG